MNRSRARLVPWAVLVDFAYWYGPTGLLMFDDLGEPYAWWSRLPEARGPQDL